MSKNELKSAVAAEEAMVADQGKEGLHKPPPVDLGGQSEPMHKRSSAPARCPSETTREDKEKLDSEIIAMVDMGNNPRRSMHGHPIPPVESPGEKRSAHSHPIISSVASQSVSEKKKSAHSHPIPPVASQASTVEKKTGPAQPMPMAKSQSRTAEKKRAPIVPIPPEPKTEKIEKIEKIAKEPIKPPPKPVEEKVVTKEAEEIRTAEAVPEVTEWNCGENGMIKECPSSPRIGKEKEKKEISWNRDLDKNGMTGRILLERKVSVGPFKPSPPFSSPSGLRISVTKKANRGLTENNNKTGHIINVEITRRTLPRLCRSGVVIGNTASNTDNCEKRAIKVVREIPHMRLFRVLRDKIDFVRNKFHRFL